LISNLAAVCNKSNSEKYPESQEILLLNRHSSNMHGCVSERLFSDRKHGIPEQKAECQGLSSMNIILKGWRNNES